MNGLFEYTLPLYTCSTFLPVLFSTRDYASLAIQLNIVPSWISSFPSFFAFSTNFFSRPVLPFLVLSFSILYHFEVPRACILHRRFSPVDTQSRRIYFEANIAEDCGRQQYDASLILFPLCRRSVCISTPLSEASGEIFDLSYWKRLKHCSQRSSLEYEFPLEAGLSN